MGILYLTITESSDQTLPGIPNTISITSNEPATIFYTLDGTVPDTYSPVYMSPISMPNTLLNVSLNILATNGIDQSSVITKTYSTSVTSIPVNTGERVSHSAVTNLNNNSTSNSLFPFGTSAPNQDFTYTGTENSGTTVYSQAQTATPSGFDANGNPAGFTNKPPSTYDFRKIYSTSNSEGEVLPGVGNLPAKTTIVGKQNATEYTQEQSSFKDKIFNPKAFVIFQDSTNEDPTNPVHINRPYFSLENQEIVRDGNLLYNSALDSPTTTGSFLKSHYNPRTNMITYYYYDNSVNRWIISSTPFQSTTKDVGAYNQMVFSRDKQNNANDHNHGFVFKWIPFMRRHLI